MVGSAKRRIKRATKPEPDPPEERLAVRHVAINGLIPVRDRSKLQFLSRSTRVPQSEYLREAIRDLLRKYRDAFDGSPFDDADPI